MISIVFKYDEVPFDLLRFTQVGITKMLKEIGFEAGAIENNTVKVEALPMIINTCISNDLVPYFRIRGIHLLVSVAICFPVQMLALLAKRALTDYGRVYLNLEIRVRKMGK